MNILVTGANGFVGKNLIPYLSNNANNIRILTRQSLNNFNVSDFQGVDVIVHLAGKAHDLKKVSDSKEYYTVNYELTKNLYDAFLASNVKKFIFISSVKAVTDIVDGVLTENTSANPQTHYGKSKLEAEKYIEAQILPHDKFYYILRPCMIHGPGNKGNLNLLLKFVRSGIPYPLAAYTNKRSFLNIANLCFIIDEIISSNIESGIYNVSDDEALSTNQVVEILAEALGKKTKLWRISPIFVKMAAKLGDALRLPLNTERLEKLTENYIVSNSKIKSAIKKKLPYGVEEGLIFTVKSLKY